MPVKVDRELLQSQGLTQALDNYKIIITANGNGQKRMDDLASSQQSLMTASSSQIAAESILDQRTLAKNSAIQSAKDAVASVDEAAKSAFEDDPATQKTFRIGVVKPKSDEGWVTYLNYLTVPVHVNADALIANGMSADDVANFPNVYSNLVAAIAAQKNSKKVRNAATTTRDAALSALKKKVAATRNFAKAALKGNKAALEEIKPIKSGGRKSSKPVPPAPEPASPQK